MYAVCGNLHVCSVTKKWKQMFYNKKIDLGYFFLVFYIFWGWIFTKTIYANSLYVYLSFIFLFVVFTQKIAISFRDLKIDNLAVVWLPFYTYTCLELLLKGNIEVFVYYYICVITVLIASVKNITNKLPYKFIIYGGILTVASIFLQMFFPDIYTQTIGNKLVYDQIETWISSEYGFNGITYQLGRTAEILIVAELVLIYMADKIKWLHRKKFFYLIIILWVIAVFLTGKRMNSLMALFIPMFVYYVSLSKITSRIKTLLIIAILLLFGISYIVLNAESLQDSPILRRLAASVINVQDSGWSGVDGGREDLFDNAWIMFQQNPLFGAGLGVFTSKYGIAVHNLYLQCLAEQGLIGFVLLVFPLIFCLVVTIRLINNNKYKLYKSYLLLALAFQLNYIIQGFSDNTTITGFILNAIAIGMVISIKNITKRNLAI